jgi:hypothetical protein
VCKINQPSSVQYDVILKSLGERWLAQAETMVILVEFVDTTPDVMI